MGCLPHAADVPDTVVRQKMSDYGWDPQDKEHTAGMPSKISRHTCFRRVDDQLRFTAIDESELLFDLVKMLRAEKDQPGADLYDLLYIKGTACRKGLIS